MTSGRCLHARAQEFLDAPTRGSEADAGLVVERETGDMRRIFGLSALLFLSCGGGDDLTPVDTCRQTYSILCDKLFNCLSPEEKEAAKGAIGLNAADCKVKFQGAECNADKAKCDAGETFRPSNADMCLSGLQTLSCNDVKADPIVTPAICDQICTK